MERKEIVLRAKDLMTTSLLAVGRQSVIIDEKIGRLIDFYRQLVEKFTPKFSTARGFQANVVHR